MEVPTVEDKPSASVKVWKHALPRARVIPFPISSIFLGNRAEIVERCHAINSAITIALVCREAQDVLRGTYQKLLAVMPSSFDDVKSTEESQPFVYIDYNVDTLCIQHCRGNEELQLMMQVLSKVKHLAWIQEPIYHSEMHWPLFRSIPNGLKSFTVVGTHDIESHDIGKEWKLVKIPQYLKSRCSLDQDNGGEYDEGEECEALQKYGHFALDCCYAKNLKGKFDSDAKDHAEWKGILFDCAILANRWRGSHQWNLNYWVERVNENSTTFDYSRGHWHNEPVNLGDGDLTSCSIPAAALVAEDLTL
ncbi:hypothetical protein N431DRAFT_447105 [Stipitochalara longipes BDJ]|nr:hypothetical protein N431DRAFT_447105 [Stipitochalara longipes BDJ]